MNNWESAKRWLLANSSACEISVITRIEILAGVTPARTKTVIEMLDGYFLHGIDRGIADRAGELRRKHRWRLPDAVQAAIAVEHGLTLATRNTKDFPPARFSFVQVPYDSPSGE